MHEVFIIESALQIIIDEAAKNNIKQIRSITLTIGELSCVMEESLLFAFNCISKGSIAENAEIKIERIKATARCDECNIEFSIDHYNKQCPCCSKFCSSIITGHELYVNSIEGE